jgi:hypothetical protein
MLFLISVHFTFYLEQASSKVGVLTTYICTIACLLSACPSGTLKLLYETIISKLRQEGRQELAFGFAPFFNVQDKPFKGRFITWIRWTNLFFYHCCNNLYAFKNLAFSKIRSVVGDAGVGGRCTPFLLSPA